MPKPLLHGVLASAIVLAGVEPPLVLAAPAGQGGMVAPAHGVIPAPTSVDLAADRFFTVSRTALILVPPGSPDVRRVAEFLAARLRPATGFALRVEASRKPPGPGHIRLTLDADDDSLGDEGYVVAIAPSGVTIRARRPAGLFYGAQTLRQLLPPAVEHQGRQRAAWRLPVGTITDRPRFEWRGAMLDVARHFFDVDTVRRYIDLLAMYKINRLHLHLSDDQGWRIEIRSWPRLTEVGSVTAVGGGPGGFYTQADYAAIVAYAQERHITVVPEIDVPGHTNAALVSYAELNCDGVPPLPYTGIEVGFSALCIGRDDTYRFLDDVVRELAAITPGPYFHVGGDEVEKLTDEQYGRFIERVQDIVERHGKRMIGWEEITKAALRPTSIVQMWRSGTRDGPPPWRNAAARRAVQLNIPLIVSPASRAYLDMKYDPETALGLNWAGYIEVKDAYDWDPALAYDGATAEAGSSGGPVVPRVIGVEAPLWTETILTLDDIEVMAFPRLPAVAEVGWSAQAARSWDEFRQRLAAHAPRWEIMGVDFYYSPQVPWPGQGER